MKNWFCFFIFLFLSASHTVSGQNIRNAIVIGASASQIDGDQMAGFNKAGFIFGGSSNFKITDNFSFQPEILFLQKGSRSVTNEDDQSNFFLLYRLNYISVPVLACYKIKPRFTLMGGLAADYLLSANMDAGYGFVDRTDELEKFDLNYTGGLEFKIWENLAANLRYQYSVKWLDDLHFKNSNVLVTLRFYLGNGQAAE